MCRKREEKDLISMRKTPLSGDFALGIALIVLSFVIALLAKVVFFLFFTDPIYRNWSIAFYVMSWLMMPVGIWLAGREWRLACHDGLAGFPHPYYTTLSGWQAGQDFRILTTQRLPWALRLGPLGLGPCSISSKGHYYYFF